MKEKSSLNIWTDVKAIVLHMRSRVKLIIATAFIIWGLSGLFVIQSNEQGVVRRFGKVVKSSINPGIHYRLPWPIEKLDKPMVKDIKRIHIGYSVQTETSKSRIIQRLTGDMNIINLSLLLQYTIRNPIGYLFSTEDIDRLVKNVAESTLTSVVGEMSVDAILTAEKLEIQDKTQMIVQERLDYFGCGVEILNCNLEKIIPPKEVMESFTEIVNAQADMDKAISEAESYKNFIIPEARGLAEATIKNAEAYTENAINKAEGESNRFLSILEEYKKAPEISKSQFYIETMEKIGQQMEKTIITEGLNNNLIKIYGINHGPSLETEGQGLFFETDSNNAVSLGSTTESSITFPVGGSNVVEEVHYDEITKRIYINEKQYFAGISKKVWEYKKPIVNANAEVTSYIDYLSNYLQKRQNQQLSNREIEQYIILAKNIEKSL